MLEILKSDVVIVGGGLVGLSLAHALASAGIETTVVDREEPAIAANDAYDGRAFAISYGSRRILEGLGLWQEMGRQAAPILDIRVTDGPSTLFLHYDHREVGDEPLGHIVESRFVRRALLGKLGDRPKLRLIAPESVARLERGKAGVVARLADGRRIAARLAVAADGRGSPIRRAAGIGAMEWGYAQTAIVCTVALTRPHEGVAHERFLPAGPFALLPLPGDFSSIVWAERNEVAPAMLALDDDGFSAAMTRRFGDALGPLRVVGRRWSYPLGLLVAERFTSDRLALIGDAAHSIHPLAGQGLNLAIRDVAALAEVIVDAHRLGLDIGAVDVLDRYASWRRLDTLALLAVTDGLNRLFSNDLGPVRLIRDLGLAAVDRLPALKRLFMNHAMGTVGDLPRLARGETL
ncbi:MAG: FAD-dependent oxidoreductase [Alphaproteobacteria bacterium]|nr:FAD-dependent oxidoreductase [Alphaproteobacteria bacterium]